MNKIYKVVWSKALEAYVVTSELAKSHAKNSSRKGLRRGVTAALLAAIAVAPVSFGVYAADDTHYVSVNSDNQSADSNYGNDGAKAKNSIAIGPSVETTGEDNIVIGSGEIVSQDKKNETSFDGKRVLVIGHGNYFQPTSDWNGQPVSYRDSAIIGHENKLLQGAKDDAGGGTPAYQIVHGWKNTLNGSFTGAIGYENEIKNSSRPGFTSQSMAFAIGTENTIDATGYYMGDKNRVNTLPDYKEPGSNPNVVGSDLYVIGRHNIIGSSKGGEWYVDNGRIFGSENIVYSNDANVFGWLNKVYASNGLAVGDGHRVGVDDKGNLVKNKNNQAIYNPVAVGRDNAVTGDYGVAVGVQAKSRGQKASAVGSSAEALSDYSVALGTESRAKGYGSVAVGSLNNTYDFDNPGYKWVDFDSGDLSSAVGVQNISTGDYSNAVGYRNITDGQSGSAFGYSNKAAEKYSFAAGALNQASGQFSSAVGGWNQAEGKKSQAVGYRNFVSGYGAVALGSENNLNFVKQYQALGFVQTGDLSSALGISNVTAGNMSSGIGNSNYAFGTKSVGVGLYNFSTGYESLAMGHYSFAGSEDLDKIDQVKYAAAIGNRAKSTITDAVAIGSFSNATRDKGDYGYNPVLGKAVTDTDITDDANIGTYRTELENARAEWQSSMEKAEELLHKIQTQQFANQAEYQQWGAEYEQLEADADAKLEAYHEAQKKVGDLVGAWQGQMAALSVGDEATGRTRQITGVAAGTEDTDAVNVAQLKALNTKVDNGAIHYYSVTSDKKVAGSNYDNDGAKAADSMVIGIGSISEVQNSTVLGNNNTLKRYTADKSGSSSRNNIVVGQSLEVEGAYNAVFGTDYQNNLENRKTMAAGKYNTVIGVGNLAGYTAEKDPQDRSKWIYSKVEDGSDSQNVVVGINNTATRGSLVLGSESEATSSGISVGHHNKVVSDEDFGVALGSNLVVDGYQSIAVGSESEATASWATAIGQEAMAKADYTTAIGTGAVAEQEDSIAFGDAAKAQNKYSIAFGSFAKATARSGVAIGSSSLADREKGAIGYLAGEETSEVWKATQGAVSVGNKEKKYTRQITGVAAGTEDTDAVNVAQLKALNTKVDNGAIHYFSVKSDDSANPAGTNWNNDGATGKDAVAIGKKAVASGQSAFATGWKSKAAGYSDIAIGREAEATGGWGVAIGQSAKAQASTAVAMAFAAEAKGANSLAIGVQSEAKTNDSSAYGRGAKALGQVALAVGTLTKAEGNHSSVFGYKATTDSTAWNGTAIGRGAYIGKQAPDGTTPDIGVSDNYYTPVDDDTVVEAGKETMNSTAVGFGAKSFGYQNTALGAGAEAFDTNTVAVGVMSKAIGHYANALGKQARAEGTNSTAIGHFARALGESSMALGDYAITSTLDGKGKVNRSVALGSHARVAADNSLALGNNSLANIADDVDTEAYLSKEAFKKENGVVSVGNKTYTIGDETIAQNYRRITNVAGGAADNDAVNVAQLKVVNTKVDKNAQSITELTTKVEGNTTSITNINQKIENLTESSGWTLAVARGDDSQTDSEATAEGASTKVNGDTVTLKAGRGVKLKQDGTNVQIGLKFIDMDPAGYPFNDAKATGGGSLAVGQNSVAGAHQATAVGFDTKADEYGVALGAASEAGKSAVAIGNNALANGDGSIAIGTAKQKVEGEPDKGLRKVDSEDAIAIGTETAVDGSSRNATAVGPYADIANSNFSTALGNSAKVQNAAYGTALGNFSRVENAAFGTALGNNAAVIDAQGGVAIGAHSVANRNAFMPGYNPIGEQWGDFWDYLEKAGQKDAYDQAEAKVNAAKQALAEDPDNPELRAKVGQAIAEQNKIFNTWAGAQGAVSIGNEQAGFTRQLTGVAAGTADTDAVNVAQLKSLATAPMNFYFGGKKEGNTYTPGTTNWSMPLNEFRMDFGDGLHAEQVTDQDGKKYTLVTLDKDSLKGDPDFKGPQGDKGDKGDKGDTGAVGPKGDKGDTGAKGDKGDKGDTGAVGAKGDKGADGKSAYEVWKDHTEDDGTQPNKDKSEKDFLDSLKGKDGADGAGGTDFTVTADGPKADSEFKVDADHAQLNIVGDKTNITTSIGADNTVKVALNKDIKVDSVEVGGKDGKPGVKIDGDGINMNGKKIENLAPGTAANDAATVGQLNEVRDESREGDAMNAALAALKPLDFDPYNRSQVMAGVSTYKGKQAVAVGLAHYSNEDTLVHAGIAYGGSSDLMANAGISWRFGDKDDRDAKAERDARMPQYADGPISSVYVLQDEMEALRAENQSLKEENQEIKRQVEMLMKHAGLKA